MQIVAPIPKITKVPIIYFFFVGGRGGEEEVREDEEEGYHDHHKTRIPQEMEAMGQTE